MTPRSAPEARKSEGRALREGLKRADQGLWKVAAGRLNPLRC